MILTELPLAGAWLIEPEPHRDERGFFARIWDAKVAAERGLASQFVQASISWNPRAGTLRGMHWQVAPHEEVKLVRVTAGAIHDVVIDLRRGSPTFGEHVGVRLDVRNRHALYVPEGFAHGFLTLADDSEVTYQMSAPYVPAAARGLRFDDPRFGIVWPAAVRVISPRDAAYPDFTG
ncbi:MAG TPA: dTDP-4-dehydrorhamnose 3,5-epimerase [Dehalococcoidia bacterium]|nr:dTDP-4-dehydrorhamnose 3,5-epimerase [Dehalococcoidia bacterium]